MAGQIASVTVRDYKRQTSTIRVGIPAGGKTLSDVKTFADYIAGRSDAQVIGYGLNEEYLGDDTSAGKYDRVLQKLTFLYEAADGSKIRATIPAPSDESVDADQEPVSDVAEDFKDALNSLAGRGISVYNGGGLNSRLPDARARKVELTGV